MLPGDNPSPTPRTAKLSPSLASERKQEKGAEDEDEDDGQEVMDSDAEAVPDAITVVEGAHGAVPDFEKRLQEEAEDEEDDEDVDSEAEPGREAPTAGECDEKFEGRLRKLEEYKKQYGEKSEMPSCLQRCKKL